MNNPENPSRLLREYSRQHSPEERHQVAQEISDKRNEQFSRRADQEDKREKIGALEQELEDLGKRMEAYADGGFYQKISEYLSIRKVKAELKEKSDLKASLSEQLSEPETGRPELDEARQTLKDFYDKERKKWAETPYTKDDIAKNFSEDHLASLSVEDYADLMCRFPGQMVTHVTRRGVRDHYAMHEHNKGLGEAGRDGFKQMLESKRLLSPLGVALSQAESYHDICTFLNHGAETVTHRDVQNSDRMPTPLPRLITVLDQYFDGRTNKDFHDKAAVHVAVEQVLDDIYGGERGNEIFVAYPSAHIASQYNFLDVPGGVVSYSGDSQHNDLYVWADNETNGMSIDAGIVFIPENAKVDKETGSLYKLDASGNPIETDAPDGKPEPNMFYGEKTDQPVGSREYWEQYFSQNPELRPSKIVYYDAGMSPTEALFDWKRKNGIVNKDVATTLGFDENAVQADFKRPRGDVALRQFRQLAIDALVEEYGVAEVALSLDPGILDKSESERQASIDSMYHV